RNNYQRDRDRIIHSAAFRRLEYKTQVFVNHEGDHYRTRLTHTIEVTQIARTIARALNLNEDLTEAIALAHDVGHTPFGHSGEEALRFLMKDYGGFEHNQQGVRMVELLEHRYPDFKGLNLSWELRESMIKHKTSYDQPKVPNRFHPEWSPLLEAQVVDVADSIAYNNHDLDDGLRSHLINENDLKKIELWRLAEEDLLKKQKISDTTILRSQIIISLINLEVGDLIKNTSELIGENNIKTVTAVRQTGTNLVAFSSKMARKQKELQSFLYEKFYKHYQVVRMSKKAKRFLVKLFNEYLNNQDQLPPRYQNWAREVGRHQSICDYIAGMTDRYAQEEYQKLFYPFERM
ncbi:MAG: deoxyguanosinetriphosphate triphosphohydrolase, partial [Planctomycetes bacterium]|nr:deoxyguanosinetriphosphate triphosphohydrolase [Planctomycetota bacterium]